MATHEFDIEVKHFAGYSLQIDLSEPWHYSGEWKNSDNYYDVKNVWVYRNDKPLREKFNDIVIKYLGKEVIDMYQELAIEREN